VADILGQTKKMIMACPRCGSVLFKVEAIHTKKPIFNGAGYDDDPYKLAGYRDIVEYRIICSKCNSLLMKFER